MQQPSPDYRPTVQTAVRTTHTSHHETAHQTQLEQALGGAHQEANSHLATSSQIHHKERPQPQGHTGPSQTTPLIVKSMLYQI